MAFHVEPKSSGEVGGRGVRLDDREDRREHKRDYAPWDEARVTVSWKGGRRVRSGGLLREIKSSFLFSPWMNPSAGATSELMFNAGLKLLPRLGSDTEGGGSHLTGLDIRESDHIWKPLLSSGFLQN